MIFKNIRIPPVVYMVLISIFIYINKVFLPIYTIVNYPYNNIWIFIIIASVIFDLWLVSLFFRQKTSSNPIYFENTSKMITSWIYKYTRNPMYLWMLFMIFWFSIFVWDISWLIWLIVFYYIITYLQIIPEEIFLEKKFWKEYLEYKKRVKRWL